MNQHKNAAMAGEGKKKCHALGRAIRKYGWDNMKTEILLNCAENEDLNTLEIKFIELENSLHPNGYNLTIGGAGCIYVQTDEIKEKRSHSMRTRIDTVDLPMYVKYRKTKYSEGFIYERPGHNAVQFTSPKLTLDEKRVVMLEHVKKLSNNPDLKLDQKRQNVFAFETVKYISFQKRINGFVVNKPNTTRKTFSDKQNNLETNYRLAVAHLNSLV
tara:strand:- start:61427 stop:62071 length:645 start_codon:yes stop_codon:yes gene_type:complete